MENYVFKVRNKLDELSMEVIWRFSVVYMLIFFLNYVQVKEWLLNYGNFFCFVFSSFSVIILSCVWCKKSWIARWKNPEAYLPFILKANWTLKSSLSYLKEHLK